MLSSLARGTPPPTVEQPRDDLRKLFRGTLQRAILAAVLGGESLATVASRRGVPLKEARRVLNRMVSRLSSASQSHPRNPTDSDFTDTSTPVSEEA